MPPNFLGWDADRGPTPGSRLAAASPGPTNPNKKTALGSLFRKTQRGRRSERSSVLRT